MEHSEHSISPDTPKAPLKISPDARSFWPSLRKWSLFLAVSCFVGAGLFLTLLVAMLVLVASQPIAGQTGSLPGLIVGIYAVFIAVFLGFGLLLLFLSNNLQRAYRHGQPEQIRHMSGSTLRYFRVVGVLGVLGVLYQVWWLFDLLTKL